MADFEKETTKKMNDTIADVKRKLKTKFVRLKNSKRKIAEAKGENKLFKKKKRYSRRLMRQVR